MAVEMNAEWWNRQVVGMALESGRQGDVIRVSLHTADMRVPDDAPPPVTEPARGLMQVLGPQFTAPWQDEPVVWNPLENLAMVREFIARSRDRDSNLMAAAEYVRRNYSTRAVTPISDDDDDSWEWTDGERWSPSMGVWR